MAQGYYGTESNPLASLHSERLALTPHTSGEPDQYGMRLRTDLNSGDRIATVLVNNGTVGEAPVIPDGTYTPSGIAEGPPVYVPGEGWGFIPIREQGGEFEEYVIWHNGTRHGVHNSLPVIADSVVDNFESVESEPVGPYQSGGDITDYYSGGTGSFERQQSTVIDDDWTLEAENHSQGDLIYSIDGDGLPRYPQKGEEFSVLMRPGNGGSPEAMFATPSSNIGDVNLGYGVRLDVGDGIELVKRLSGFSSLDSTSAPITAGEDYEVVVEWHDGSGSQTNDTIVATVFEWNGSRESEVGSVSAQDSDGAGNLGIAFIEGAENIPTNRWDGFRYIKDIGEPTAYFAANGVSLPTHDLNRPHAVYDGSNNDTYVVYQGEDLNPYTATYDHDGESWSSVTQVEDNPLTDDNHGAPSICQTDDGHLHVFYGSHNSSQPYARSDNPSDASSWTTQSDIGSDLTYPKPVVDGNTINLFARHGHGETDNRAERLYRSTDGGDSWSQVGDIIEFGSPFWIYTGDVRVDGSDVHLAWLCDDASADLRLNVYHAIYDLSDDSLRAQDGTSLTTPLSKSDADTNCLVYDSETDSEQTNSIRVGVDGSGVPYILFNHDNSGTWEHRFIEWDSSGWTTPTTIADSDHMFQAGDLRVNSPTDIEAYLPVGGSGSSAMGGDMEYWTYDGSAWSKQATVVAEADTNHPLNYPSIPREDGGLDAIFSENNAENFSTRLRVYAADGSDTVDRD